MKIKILIYLFIILFLIFLGREYKILSKLGIGGNSFFLSLFLIYFLLLYLEIKAKIDRGLNYREIKKTGFIFSFWIGVVWGIIISFYRGFPKFKNLYAVFTNLIGYAIAGLVIGLVGMGITVILLKYVIRTDKNGNTH